VGGFSHKYFLLFLNRKASLMNSFLLIAKKKSNGAFKMKKKYQEF
jgi:hypothetical protein